MKFVRLLVSLVVFSALYALLLAVPAKGAEVTVAWDPIDTTLPFEEIGIWIHFTDEQPPAEYQKSDFKWTHDAGLGTAGAQVTQTTVANLEIGKHYWLIAQGYRMQNGAVVLEGELSNQIDYGVPGLSGLPEKPPTVEVVITAPGTVRIIAQ